MCANEVKMRRGIAFWFLCLAVVTLACKTLVPGPSQVEWNLSPQVVVLEVLKNWGAAGGSAEEGFGRNYIPHARVWSDGRIIWVRDDAAGGARTVWEGQFSQAELQQLLKKVVDSGYFTWKYRYAPFGPFDNPPFTQLKARLVSSERVVMVVFKEGPPGYQELLDTLTSGAGARPTKFQPPSAFLSAYPVSMSSGNAPPAWDATAAGFSLDQASQGRWVRGTALQDAWQAVNQSPRSGAYFESNGKSYVLTLRVPAVSLDEPPPEPAAITPSATPPEPAPSAPSETPPGQDIPTASPVRAQVLIKNGASAAGGAAGSTIHISVNFTAISSAGPVTEMRVQAFGFCGQEPSGNWEPFVPEKSYPFHLPINWVTWRISAQFRDAQGNLSPVVCDDIGVEGMPERPTSQP